VLICRRGVPPLEERRAGRQDEERGADGSGEQRQHPRGGRPVVGRREPGDDGGKRQPGGGNEPQVDDRLGARAREPVEQVGVEVAREEQGLEGDQAGVPDRRGAAEQRQ
jgi:hypothetical protein